MHALICMHKCDPPKNKKKKKKNGAETLTHAATAPE